MDIPRKIGDPVLLMPRSPYGGRTIIKQLFTNPKTGGIDEYYLYDSLTRPANILPITHDGRVVAIRQFRHGANDILLEIPGGNQKYPDETPEQIACRELREETGYEAEKLIYLGRKIFMQPVSHGVAYHPFLGLRCHKVAEPQHDDSEHIEVLLIPLKDWVEMCIREQNDPFSIATTFAALPYLGIKLVYPD